MKIALKGPSICCCSEAFRQTKQLQEQAECIVPDVYEDIGKIAFAQAQLYLKSKEAADHAVCIGAAAEIHVFYITERRDRVRCLSFGKSFEITFDSPAIVPEADLQIALSCTGVQARAVNPRKISAQLSVRAELCCLADGRLSIPEETEEAPPDGLQLRCESIECVVDAPPREKSFVINEQLPLEQSEEITAISCVRAELVCGDHQPIGSKVLIKGGAELVIGCETQNGNCPVFLRHCLPFSVLIDMPDEDCVPGNVLLETTAIYADLSEAINSSRVIDLELHAAAQISFEKSGQIRCLSDAYSTICPVNTEKSSASLSRSRGRQRLTAKTVEHIAVESDRGELVSAFAELLSCSVRDGKSEISLTVCLLLRDADGCYGAQQRIISFETTLPETGGEIAGARISAVHAERAGEEIVLEASVLLEYIHDEMMEVQYLSSIDPDMDNAFDRASLPALTIARRGRRDLWELAKLYHSSVEAIGELNAKYPMGEELLLIPRA